MEICKLVCVKASQGWEQQPCLKAWPMLQEMAFEASQKYKEGKFIIEKARLLKVHALLVWPAQVLCLAVLNNTSDNRMKVSQPIPNMTCICAHAICHSGLLPSSVNWQVLFCVA